MNARNVNGTVVRLERGDLTALDIEAIVFAARPDLSLGSGFGNAIAVRGGPKIQEELKRLAPVEVGKAVATPGGNLKARWIVHAVVPRFQEADEERKLAEAVASALRCAEDKGVKALAIPPLTSGFYGMPIDTCARVVVDGVKRYLGEGQRGLKEVVLCVRDTHEVKAFEKRLEVF